MADGKIYITISDTRGGSTGGEQLNSSSNPAIQQQTTKKSGSSDLQKILALKAFDAAVGIAEQSVNYTISNIGNFTGNYQAQRDTQVAMSMLSEIIGVGETAASAYMMGGGGVSGAVVAAVAVTIQTGMKIYNKVLEINTEKFENRRINRNIEYMRNRLGLEGLTNGSRSGGY